MPLTTRITNTFTNRISENIFFLHIPKCGGVSISQAIAAKYLSLDPRNDRGIVNLNAPVSRQVIETTEGLYYPYETDDDYPILNFREKLLLYFIAQSSSRFISGHFLFSNIAYRRFGEKFSFVTVLRDPVKRWISSYFFNHFKSDGHMKVHEDIETHIKSHFGISQGYELVKFLGGANREGDYTSAQAINQAQNNLHKFKIVGFLEHPEEFKEKFHASFNVKLQIDKKNQNPAPLSYQKSVLTPKLIERITELCQPDLEVYSYAVETFVNTS